MNSRTPPPQNPTPNPPQNPPLNPTLNSGKPVHDAESFNHEAELSAHPQPPHLSAIPSSAHSGLGRTLLRLDRWIDRLFRALMICAGLSLAGLMFAQVILRYLLESAFAGIEEVAILIGVWIYFLGMGYATRVREHIHGGIVGLVVSDPFKVRLIRLFGSLVSMTAAVIFGYFACRYALFVIDKGRVSIYLQWPRGLWSASMIVGFLMMTGYFLLEALREFRDLRHYRFTRHLEARS